MSRYKLYNFGKEVIKMAKNTEIVTFATTPDIKKALQSLAEHDERTLSQTVHRIIKDYLANKK